jgi:hypothetical protein
MMLLSVNWAAATNLEALQATGKDSTFLLPFTLRYLLVAFCNSVASGFDSCLSNLTYSIRQPSL